ncbi:MAG: pilus assembly FimT family protein [bacterium]
MDDYDKHGFLDISLQVCHAKQVFHAQQVFHYSQVCHDSKGKNGFTIIEAIAVTAIILIISAVAIMNFEYFYNIYKFQEYAYRIEYTVKQAKAQAMENSFYVGICPSGNTLTVNNLGNVYPSSLAGACSGTPIETINIQNTNYVLNGTNTILDPRGFALYSSGYYCLYNKQNNSYYEICIGQFGAFFVQKGGGTCAPCPAM